MVSIGVSLSYNQHVSSCSLAKRVVHFSPASSVDVQTCSTLDFSTASVKTKKTWNTLAAIYYSYISQKI